MPTCRYVLEFLEDFFILNLRIERILMINMDVTVSNRDITLLAPKVQQQLSNSLIVCKQVGYPVVVTEGYRTPERQNWLYEQGRRRPGAIVTKKRAWGSWHQCHTAIDICFVVNGKWSWDKDLPWEKTAKIFIDHGFSWLFPFEKAHFQMTANMKIADASKHLQAHGKESLWELMGLTVT